MESKSKVFVTQEMPRLDYVPAQRFGEIVFITRDDFSPVQSSLANKDLCEDIRSGLAEFDPKNDYIVFSGSPAVAAAVFAFIGRKTDAFRMLRWSNRDGFYTPISIQV